MALTTTSLNSSLNSIGISQAKGVELPMLRDQNSATLPKASSNSTADKEATAPSTSTATRYTASAQLTIDQQRRVAELQQIDRDVRAHEQAHMAAGHGVITSGPNYSYTYGPDGKQYATGGEVGIDTSFERKPEANIDKGIRIQAAALAPKDPSPQDYQVASIGERMESTGRSDLYRQQLQQQAEAEAEAAARRQAEREAQAKSLIETPSPAVELAALNQSPGTDNASSTQQASSQRLVRAYGPAQEGDQKGAASLAVSLFA